MQPHIRWNPIPIHKKTPFTINSVLFFTVFRKGSISKLRGVVFVAMTVMVMAVVAEVLQALS